MPHAVPACPETPAIEQEARIIALVDQAPPLTAERLDQLAAILGLVRRPAVAA